MVKAKMKAARNKYARYTTIKQKIIVNTPNKDMTIYVNQRTRWKQSGDEPNATLAQTTYPKNLT